MKKPSDDSMLRLLDGGADGANEGRAADLLRGCFFPRDPTASELARISRALAPSGVSRRTSRLALRLAVALSCIMAGAATVKAYELARRAGWLGKTTATAPLEGARSRTSRKATSAPQAKAEPMQARADMEEPVAPTPPIGATGALTSVPLAGSEPREAEGERAPAGLAGRGIDRAAEVRDPPTQPAAPASDTLTLPPARTPVGHPPAGLAGRGIDRAAEVREPATQPATRASDMHALAPARTPVDDRLTPMPAAPAVASPVAISEETRELDHAIGYLRRDHNAAAALAALDTYLGRYPHGALRREAHLVRIDALLALGRTEQALAALEVTTFDPGLRSTELLTVRAELRAASDCHRAEQDFTMALGRRPDGSLLERLLYGRGVCRIKLQDRAGASEDVRSYLAHFPNGARAQWARRWEATLQASVEKGR